MYSRGEGKMKKRDLEKKLKKAGWVVSSGTKHDKATNQSKPGVRLTIPRHTEINEQTAKGILEDAGLE